MFVQDNDDDDVNELLHMRKACMGTLNLFARCGMTTRVQVSDY